MPKVYQIAIRWYVDENDFSQWVIEMDPKQLAAMRALLERGVAGHAYVSYALRPHKLGTYNKTFADLAEMIKNKSY
jgi:hypothetical protein